MNIQRPIFDEISPRGRIYVRLATSVGLAILTATVAFILYRLWLAGQLSYAKWAPLIDPSNQKFRLIWRFLAEGLRATFLTAITSILFSGLVALGLASISYLRGRVANIILRIFVTTVRATPLLLIIFFTARILPDFGLDLPTFWYLVLALTLFNSVIVTEALRSGISGVPVGQTEAALALGLSKWHSFIKVILPQAIRIVIPVLITQAVIVIQATSLGFIISYEELLRKAQIAVQTLHNPIQLYFVVAIIYVFISILVSRISKVLLLRRA